MNTTIIENPESKSIVSVTADQITATIEKK